MKSGTNRVLGSWCLALTVLVSPLAMAQGEAKSAATEASKVETRALMDAIFAPLSRVLPRSFNDADFTAVSNRPQIQADLDILAQNAKQLERHGIGQTRNFEYVARSLSRDAANVKRWYARGYFEEARFTLHNMTENCISCHSTLPSPSSSTFKGADGFFKDVQVEKLPMLERAHLQVLARQYDQALTTYESYLDDVKVQPAFAIASSAFVDYLKVAICATKDAQRPAAFLAKLDGRAEAGSRAKLLIKDWREVLTANQDLKTAGEPALKRAKALIKAGQARMEYPGDRAALVQYAAAESLLLNLINSSGDRGSLVAEAYYNLGIAESVLEHAFWLSKADFYLESAIRLAPASPFAPKAYAMLEENFVLGYTGSSGTHLPDDVEALLKELKKLISDNQGKRSSAKRL